MQSEFNFISKNEKKTTYCVRITYDGSNFSGWAKQSNLRTVEGEINKILKLIFRIEIAVSGVSRTDAGVHAYDQIFTFSLPFFITIENLIKILNHHFNQSIKINSIKIVPNDYDVRKNVKYKEYRYYINTDSSYNPFKFNYQYQYGKKISLKKIRKVLKLFLGCNYFYNFSGLTKNDWKYPYRIINKIKVYQSKKEVVIIIQAKGFLRYQIRYIIAAALDYCQDKITLADIRRYLSSEKKEKYPNPKVVAQGLYLYKVFLKDI